MTCPQCNDTGCEPQFVPSGDWYCVLCHVCDPSQPRPVAVELLGDRCETCLGSGRVMEIDRTFFDGGWMPAYVEVECGECNGLGNLLPTWKSRWSTASRPSCPSH